MSHFRKYAVWYGVGLLLVATVVIWVSMLARSGNELKVVFLDVGQGDAALITAPSGMQMLIDGGPNNAVLRELGKVMPFWDRSIDVVIATHPDADHIGGLPEVFRRYDVDVYIESGNESETAVFKTLLREIEKENPTRYMARRGMVVYLDEETSFRILFPDRDVSGVDPNAASVVGQLVYKDTEILFTGDAPKAIERYLVELDGTKLQSDILKVGHHGSKTSTDEEFLRIVSPAIAVISAGKDNRYGHPHEEIVGLLRQLGIDIRRVYDGDLVEFTF